jgi:Uma2 family endonuclease
MGMPQAAPSWTVEQVLALPDDGNRYEVVDGELLVTPAPAFRHQDAILALVRRIEPFVRSGSVGHLSISPADLELDERTLVQPDIFVFELPGGKRPDRWKEIRDILLAVEVLSPSTARADRQVKRLRYQRYGIPEYWIVDLDARLVERWTPEDQRPEVLHEALSWQPTSRGPALTLDLPALFRELLGD